MGEEHEMDFRRGGVGGDLGADVAVSSARDPEADHLEAALDRVAHPGEYLCTIQRFLTSVATRKESNSGNVSGPCVRVDALH